MGRIFESCRVEVAEVGGGGEDAAQRSGRKASSLLEILGLET